MSDTRNCQAALRSCECANSVRPESTLSGPNDRDSVLNTYEEPLIRCPVWIRRSMNFNRERGLGSKRCIQPLQECVLGLGVIRPLFQVVPSRNQRQCRESRFVQGRQCVFEIIHAITLFNRRHPFFALVSPYDNDAVRLLVAHKSWGKLFDVPINDRRSLGFVS